MPKSRCTATFEDGDEPWRCRARTKSSTAEEPVRCGNAKEPHYQVCRYHGARGGRPIIHGKRSRRLGRFQELYEEAKASGEELFDLRDTLAIMDVALDRAAERVAQLDTPDFREAAFAIFEDARQQTDAEQQRKRLADLGRLLRDGVSEDEAFKQLTEAAQALAHRQEKAWAVRLNAAQALNARDLVVVMNRFIQIVTEESPEHAGRIVERIDLEVLGGREVAQRLPPSADP